MNNNNTTPPLNRPFLHVTASAVVEKEGRFLLVEEHAEGRIVINQPSGHIEERELPLAATIRETLEETGWIYEPKAVVGIYFYFSPNSNVTYQRICFTGDLIRHCPERPLDEVILKTLWLTPAEIEAEAHRLRSPMVLRCVKDYLLGKRYDLNLITDLL